MKKGNGTNGKLIKKPQKKLSLKIQKLKKNEQSFKEEFFMYGISPFEKKTYDLFNAFHDFEENFFGNTSLPSCKTDIKDEGDKYVLEAELPGFDKEDIKLDLNGDSLTITAEHSTSNDEKDNDGKYIRRERTYGSYQRTFDVSTVDTEKIGAEYKNGVLILDMPKKQVDEPKVKRLEIK